MNHEAAIKVALQANLTGIENGEPPTIRTKRIIAAYLKARGAILCDPVPAVYESHKGTHVSVAYYEDLVPASQANWTPLFIALPTE